MAWTVKKQEKSLPTDYQPNNFTAKQRMTGITISEGFHFILQIIWYISIVTNPLFQHIYLQDLLQY